MAGGCWVKGSERLRVHTSAVAVALPQEVLPEERLEASLIDDE